MLGSLSLPTYKSLHLFNTVTIQVVLILNLRYLEMEHQIVIPGYAENESSLLIILGSFAGIIAVVLLAALALANMINPALRKADCLTLSWFTICKF